MLQRQVRVPPRHGLAVGDGEDNFERRRKHAVFKLYWRPLVRTRMKRWTLAAVTLWAAACSRGPAALTVLHFNDVYEIDAVENGRAGGLARVATVRPGLLKPDPSLM